MHAVWVWACDRASGTTPRLHLHSCCPAEVKEGDYRVLLLVCPVEQAVQVQVMGLCKPVTAQISTLLLTSTPG